MSDFIRVSPNKMHEMANTFHKASQDTSNMLDELKRTAEQLINDLYSELKYSPEALQLVCTRWYKATDSEKDFLQEVALSLNTVADNFQNVDKNAIPPAIP